MQAKATSGESGHMEEAGNALTRNGSPWRMLTGHTQEGGSPPETLLIAQTAKWSCPHCCPSADTVLGATVYLATLHICFLSFWIAGRTRFSEVDFAYGCYLSSKQGLAPTLPGSSP